MENKRFLCLILCTALAFALLPVSALAAGGPDDYTFSVSAGTVTIASGTDTGTLKVTHGGGSVEDSIPADSEITVTGASSSAGIVVEDYISAKITLEDVSIAVSGCAFYIDDHSVVDLTLAGSNFLTSGNNNAGLRVVSGAALAIGGAGSLRAQGGFDGAGIGGGFFGSGGDITINGGTVTANGGLNGAGIGGGYGGSGGSVVVNGGTVTANGGSYGAGIGGGEWESGGSVYISGGSVNAADGGGGQDIGYGSGGSGGTLKNKAGGVDIFLTTVTLEGIEGGAAVTALTTNAGYTYGTTDMFPDEDGKLYLYLPEGTVTTAVRTNAGNYTGTVTTDAAGSASATFQLTQEDFAVTGDASGYAYGADGVLTFTVPGSYTISMSEGIERTTTDRIVVAGDSADVYDITLNGVNIDVSAASECAFNIDGNSTVNLTLVGNNFLTSGLPHAGLRVVGSAALTIDGAGSLTVNGGFNGAGIGGGFNGSCGSVTVIGGAVTANGGWQGAGIGGGGYGGNGGSVTIAGGTVTANGAGGGAGIGGGLGRGSGGSVVISGGTVTANGGGGGAGIGGGWYGGNGTVYISGGSVNATGDGGGQAIGYGLEGSGGTLMNKAGGDPVFLSILTIPGVNTATAVTELTVVRGGSPYEYGIEGMFTDEGGRLYLYLPENASVSAVRAADTDRPTVVSVTPSGTGAALSGDLVITFNEEMRTGGETISINGAPLTGGVWNSEHTVFTLPYSGLAYGTVYTVSISGFMDYSGNAMVPDASHGFTTQTNPDPGPGPVHDGPSGSDTPTVATGAVTGVTQLGATLNGSVLSDGGKTIVERGFVYGASASPVIGGTGVTKVIVSNTGGFTAALTGLSADTMYCVRAYAVNCEGISYGAPVSFRTQAVTGIGVPNTGGGFPIGGCLLVMGALGVCVLARRKKKRG